MTEQYLTREQVRQNMIRKITYSVLGLVLVAGAVFGIVKLQQASDTGSVLGLGITEGEHIIGNPGAKVQLVEYADLQCPGCAAFHPIVKKLLEEHKDDIYFSYRHFPLSQIHANANVAAYAAEAAGKQGKFFEMTDLMYTNQAEWSSSRNAEELFVGYAKSLGLNEQQFISDSQSTETKVKVKGDYESGIASNVNSTPSFFVNGQKIANPSTYEQFVELIQNAKNQQ